MSCVDCTGTLKEQQIRLDSVRKEAKKLAVEKQENVYIYADFQGNIQYVISSAAATADISRILDTLSFVQ